MVAKIFVFVLAGLVFIGSFLQPIVSVVQSIDIDTANSVDGFIRVALPVAIVVVVLVLFAIGARRHQNHANRHIQGGDD